MMLAPRCTRKVRFFSHAKLVLIPSLEDFIEAGIHGDVWYTPTELRCFRRRAEFEWRVWQEWRQSYNDSKVRALAHAVQTVQTMQTLTRPPPPTAAVAASVGGSDASIEADEEPQALLSAECGCEA